MSQQFMFRVVSRPMSIGLIMSFAFALAGCAGGAGGPPPSQAGFPKPDQMAATPTTMPTTIATDTPAAPRPARAVGTLTAPSRMSLAFQSSGLLRELNVKEGDKVKAGDVLAKLDTTALDLQVIQSQTALNLQQINLDKVKAGPTKEDIAIAMSTLDQARVALDQAQAAYDPIAWRPDAGMTTQAANLEVATSKYQAAKATYEETIHHPTDSELATAQTLYDQAKAALAIVKQNLTYTTLTAPIDGTILSVVPKAGEIASQGVSVMTLADLSHMQAETNLDENTLSRIHVGQEVKLTLDAFPDKVLTGHVSRIARTGTSSQGVVSVPVTIDIDANDTPLYPGLSATLEFKTGQ